MMGVYNLNILTFSWIRATMVESDYSKDMKYYVVLSPSSSVSDIANDLFSDNLFPSISEFTDSGSIN